MRPPLYKAVVLLVLIAAATASTNARTFPLDNLTRGAQEFFGTVSYEVEKAYAGTESLELIISLSTRGTTNLEVLKLEPPDPTNIVFTQISSNTSTDPQTGLQKSDYKYRVKIAEGTEPRIYLVSISFGSPNEKNISRAFELIVGVRNKGKLAVVSDGVSAAEFYTGSTNKYRLELENNFPQFPVNIRSVTIKSDPLGLIESATVPIQNVTIDSLQRGAIELDLKTAQMSFSNLLSGFSDSPKVIFQISYDDTYGHVVTDLVHPVNVKIRPRDHVLVIAMFIGVFIGAVLKLYLQRLQAQGIINGREVIMAVGITSLIGLVVSFVAVVGRIKIIAFDQMGSYDNPAVIFVISLAGAVGGAQLLSTLFKAATGSSATPANTTATPAPPTPTATPAAAKPTA